MWSKSWLSLVLQVIYLQLFWINLSLVRALALSVVANTTRSELLLMVDPTLFSSDAAGANSAGAHSRHRAPMLSIYFVCEAHFEFFFFFRRVTVSGPTCHFCS